MNMSYCRQRILRENSRSSATLIRRQCVVITSPCFKLGNLDGSVHAAGTLIFTVPDQHAEERLLIFSNSLGSGDGDRAAAERMISDMAQETVSYPRDI